MELPPLFQAPFTDIPPIFRAHDTGSYLSRCVMCDADVLGSGQPYLIEKAIKEYPEYGTRDTVFEYAMCLNCATEMRKRLSTDSVTRMEQFFSERTNLVERRQTLLEEEKLDVDDWVGSCIITDHRREALTEYQVCAQCQGSDMIYTYMPYMISSQALDEVQQLLSPQTKDELDDFIDNHFGLPPELKDLVKDRPSMLV